MALTMESHHICLFFEFNQSLFKEISYSFDFISNSAMNTKIFLVDNTCNWQGVKSIHKHLKDLLTIFFGTLKFKVIKFAHNSWLMISPQHDNIFWWGDFHQHQQAHNFNRHNASINIVSQKYESVLSFHAWTGNIDVFLRIDFFLWEES